MWEKLFKLYLKLMFKRHYCACQESIIVHKILGNNSQT